MTAYEMNQEQPLYECPSGAHGMSEKPGVCPVVVPWGTCGQRLVPVAPKGDRLPDRDG